MNREYFFWRLFWTLPTLLGACTLTFFLVQMVPGGSWSLKSGMEPEFGPHRVGVSSNQIEALQEHFLFHRPVMERYTHWLKQMVLLDFGNSWVYQEPALSVIGKKLKHSLELIFISSLLALIFAIPWGVQMALFPNHWFRRVSELGLTGLASVPVLIWAALFLVFGKLSFSRFLFPVICGIFAFVPEWTFLTRNSVEEALRADHIRTAKAKGLGTFQRVYGHALRNAWVPLITHFSGAFSGFLSLILVVETIFDLDGVGRLAFQSVVSKDYNVILALTLISSWILILLRLFSDWLCAFLDPRFGTELQT